MLPLALLFISPLFRALCPFAFVPSPFIHHLSCVAFPPSSSHTSPSCTSPPCVPPSCPPPLCASPSWARCPREPRPRSRRARARRPCTLHGPRALHPCASCGPPSVKVLSRLVCAALVPPALRPRWCRPRVRCHSILHRWQHRSLSSMDFVHWCGCRGSAPLKIEIVLN